MPFWFAINRLVPRLTGTPAPETAPDVNGCQSRPAFDHLPPLKHREKGIRIFTWPKVIYIFPSAIVALICAIGMWSLKDKTYDPTGPSESAAGPRGRPARGRRGHAATPRAMTKRERFRPRRTCWACSS